MFGKQILMEKRNWNIPWIKYWFFFCIHDKNWKFYVPTIFFCPVKRIAPRICAKSRYNGVAANSHRRFQKRNEFNTWLAVALATATLNETSKKRNGMRVVIKMIHAFRSGDKAAHFRKLTRFITTEDALGRINVLLESNQWDNVIIELYARHAQDRYDDDGTRWS